MVRILVFVAIMLFSSHANNAYERNCIKCHEVLPFSLQEIFMRYLAAYGGENNVKVGLDHYFKYPAKDISVMSVAFLNHYGIDHHSKINEKELKQAIDIYWQKHKVIGRLK